MEDIKEYLKKCDICQLTRPSQQKEPLIPHDIWSGPWEKVGIDIFQHRSLDYLLVADYFSNFPLVRLLNNQRAPHMENILKMMFFNHGILAQVFTEQGRQFNHLSSMSLRFQILPFMPRYLKSNGFIESIVRSQRKL